MKLRCIKCSNGCKLTLIDKEGRVKVKGNKCSKGKKYALKLAQENGVI